MIVAERSYSRFMMVPRPAMEGDLKNEEKELTEDIKNLEKKVRTVSFHPPYSSITPTAI